MEFTQHVHCAHCKQREFLPFECKSCAASFCLAHRTREAHECPAWVAEEAAAKLAPKPSPIALPTKYKCSKPGCKVREIISINCRNCAHNFCIAHRFPTQHKCEAFGKQAGGGGAAAGASAAGLHRNTILPAGIVPPRPLDADRSSRHSTQPLASASAHAPIAVHAASAVAASVVSTTAAQPSPPAASVPASVDAPLAADPAAARVTSPLLFTNHGSSCAAEMSQAASAAATKSDAADATSSTPSATAVAPPSSAAAAASMRHHNTNVAHLSKLLKQHS